MIEVNKIYNESYKDTLNREYREFIDLTITSPPYNVDLGFRNNNGFSYDLYKDNKDFREYFEMLRDVFSMIFERTVSGGRCVINIGSIGNGKIPVYSILTNIMLEIGWIPYTTIIWNKNNTSCRTAWGSWKSCSSPSFPTPFEYILVFCKESLKLKWKGVCDLTAEQFTEYSLAMWSFGGEKKSVSMHPAAFPIELPLRCIKMFSYLDSIVYDPFMGSGSTAIACKRSGRYYIGSEISSNYVSIANNRLLIDEK